MSRTESPRVGPIGAIVRIASAPLRWVERTRGVVRLGLLGLYAAILAGPMLVLIRESMIRSLPDIGPPIDVEAALVSRQGEGLDPEENAAVWYRRAAAACRPDPEGRSLDPGDLAADPRLRGMPWVVAWRRANRQALDCWRIGTRCDRIAPEAPDGSWPFDGGLAALAMLEAYARLDAEGDPVGAWEPLLGLLRYTQHRRVAALPVELDPRRGVTPVPSRGTSGVGLPIERVQGLIFSWAADDRLDAPTLRRALADAKAAAALARPSDLYRAHLLRLEALLDDPPEALIADARAVHRGGQPNGSYATPPVPIGGTARGIATPVGSPAPGPIPWPLLNEPERSRRLIRLVFANWLARCDEPLALQPPLVRPADGAPWLYDEPTAGLTPAELAGWFGDAPVARLLLRDPEALWARSTADQQAIGQVLIDLAEQLYLREHGDLPPTVNALVGPYLDRLPDGYGGGPELPIGPIDLPPTAGLPL